MPFSFMTAIQSSTPSAGRGLSWVVRVLSKSSSNPRIPKCCNMVGVISHTERSAAVIRNINRFAPFLLFCFYHTASLPLNVSKTVESVLFYKKTDTLFQVCPLCCLRQKLIFPLTSSFRLLLTLYAWLFIVLSLADLLLDSCLSTVALESA